MRIRVIEGSFGELRETLWSAIQQSRFSVGEIENQSNSRTGWLKLRTIRLKEAKPFCGSHPIACDIAGGRRAKFLEGADWVEFNDLINDVCDDLGISADIKTAVCQIRDGRRRRIRYDAYWQVNQWQWVMHGDDNDYKDWCKKDAPDSWYPEGTPGLYLRKELVRG
jgi:hypothetical protein